MSVDAVWMNFWSVGPQLCPWTLSPREQPLERNENERRRNDADPPQDARIIGGEGEPPSPVSGVATWRSPLLEDERAVRADPAHADRVVEGDRWRVLGAHEEANGRSAREQKAAQVGEAAFPIALASHGGSTQTCCSWTARSVQADASALKRTVPPSSQSQLRPSSICVRVRHSKSAGSRA